MGGAVVHPEMAITVISSVDFLLAPSTNPHLYPSALPNRIIKERIGKFFGSAARKPVRHGPEHGK
jgi:hypothetical protein